MLKPVNLGAEEAGPPSHYHPPISPIDDFHVCVSKKQPRMAFVNFGLLSTYLCLKHAQHVSGKKQSYNGNGECVKRK